MAAPKNGATTVDVWLIASDWDEMRIEKTVSSGDWSFRNNLEKFDDNPPFRYF